MKRICTIILIAISFSPLFSQTFNSKESLSSGIEHIDSGESFYLMQGFSEGMIYFNDKTKSQGTLNYSLLHEKVHFIDSTGRILALSDLSNVKYISIGERLLINSPKYGVLEVSFSGEYTLLIKRRLVLLNGGKTNRGAYGTPGSTASISEVDKLQAGNVLSADLLAYYKDYTNNNPDELTYEESYYIQYKNRIKVISNVKSIYKSISKEKQQRVDAFFLDKPSCKVLSVGCLQDLFQKLNN
ncbi:MAG: hypothetical protein RBS81_04925 [Tenuifilaceae bacterium]|jgi:hypothetical protein|nr:hypothetical protein [Tenuifilaceae bacterium]